MKPSPQNLCVFKSALVALAITGALSLSFASTAQASHYYLTDLKRFETSQVVLFRDQGLQTTEHVLSATLTPQSRKALAAKVGLSEEVLLDPRP